MPRSKNNVKNRSKIFVFKINTPAQNIFYISVLTYDLFVNKNHSRYPFIIASMDNTIHILTARLTALKTAVWRRHGCWSL